MQITKQQITKLIENHVDIHGRSADIQYEIYQIKKYAGYAVLVHGVSGERNSTEVYLVLKSELPDYDLCVRYVSFDMTFYL